MSELLVLLALVLLVVLILNVVQKAFSLLGLAAIGLLLAGLFRWFTSGTPLPNELINTVGLANWIKLPQPTVVAKSSPPATPTPFIPAPTAANFTTQNLNAPNRAASSTALTTQGGYRVVCPPQFQVLNVRNAPGLSDRIAALPCGTVGISITGPGSDRDGETWVPIQSQQVRGWVARRFLNP